MIIIFKINNFLLVPGASMFDGLTHSCREDDNSQYVHAFTGTGNNFILDVWSGRDLQEHRVAQFRVVVVGHHIHIVCLRFLDVGALNYRNQVCSILKENGRKTRLLICEHEKKMARCE